MLLRENFSYADQVDSKDDTESDMQHVMDHFSNACVSDSQ